MRLDDPIYTGTAAERILTAKVFPRLDQGANYYDVMDSLSADERLVLSDFGVSVGRPSTVSEEIVEAGSNGQESPFLFSSYPDGSTEGDLYSLTTDEFLTGFE